MGRVGYKDAWTQEARIRKGAMLQESTDFIFIVVLESFVLVVMILRKRLAKCIPVGR